ncbi:MAG: hypothetical protein Q4F21_06335, partial [Lachnospiraceae bacterium]|nr:hypothetical protein [Lachnospiraceae bacterium]
GYAWFISNGESCGNGNIVEYIQYGHEDGKDQNGNVIDAYPIEEEMKELINEAAADPSNHGLKALVSTDGFYIS